MTHQPISRDLTRITLGVLFIGVLMAASFWILRPFLLALIWATMIVVATWPIMLRFQGWFAGKRWLAVVRNEPISAAGFYRSLLAGCRNDRGACGSNYRLGQRSGGLLPVSAAGLAREAARSGDETECGLAGYCRCRSGGVASALGALHRGDSESGSRNRPGASG